MPTGGPNLFGIHQFDNKDSFFSGQALLSQAVGYAVVVGFGGFFVVLTLAITYLDLKFGGTNDNSEHFNTAGRSLKTGLVAVDAVSRWTWVATFVVSINQTYLYGISGAFWFTSTSIITLFLFAIFTVELKRKAPNAHTVIELVHIKWGKFASFAFLYLCYLNNFMICALLFIAAGNILAAVTGMNIYVTLVIIPLGIMIYTFYGGLMATFTSSYVHTAIIYVALNIFVYKVYASDKEPIGSISKVWDNLNLFSTVIPVKGNKEGSYMTMFSKSGLELGILNMAGVFGITFADQASWQGAIGGSAKGALHGLLLGGILWFPIAYSLATGLGLAARALDLPMSTDEFNQGLVIVATAQYLMGKGGVVLVLTIVFMSVTSTGSSELMAMSSLWTYDLYKRYINPRATNKQLLVVSRASVVIFGILTAGISCLCKLVGLDVNFLFFVGTLVMASAFPPLYLMISWEAVPAGAAIASALGGHALSVIAWLIHTQVVYGRMTVDTLERLGPSLDGTLVGVLSSTFICVVWTLVAPENGDRAKRWLNIQLPEGVQVLEAPKDDLQIEHVYFNKYSYFAISVSIVVVILWPALTLPAGVFSKGYFTFWVVVSLIWATLASAVAIFLPLVEARQQLLRIAKRALLGHRDGQLRTSPVSENELPVTVPMDYVPMMK